MNNLKKTILYLLSVMAVSTGIAQESIELEQVVVTASQIPMESYKTGRSLSVITSEELQEMPVSTIEELLRFLPGINLNARSGFGVQTDIGMRGSTFAQVLVLIDNVRFNDPLTAHFNNYFPIPLADIHHVEIIRGTAAASYGSDAVGGVIHIKTKAYVHDTESAELLTNGDFSIGEHNLNRTDVGVGFNHKKLLFTAAYKANIADGEEHINPNYPAISSADSLYNNHFDIRTITAGLSAKLSNSLKLYGRVGYDYRDFKAKYFYTNSAFDESNETVKGLWTQATMQYVKEGHLLQLDAGYRKGQDYFLFNPLFTANEHETKQYSLNLKYKFDLNDKTSLATGVQYIDKNIESTDRGNHENSAVGIYGILSYALSSNMHANLSLRGENDANFGWEFLPQASLSYKKNDLLLRASYGRSVRAGDFTERYVSSLIPELTPGRNVGNPDLVAESSHSFDLGGEWTLGKKGRLSLTGFYRTSENLIDYALTNSNDINNVNNLVPNEDYYYASNVAESETYGVEFSLGQTLALSNDVNITGEVNYTYIETNTPSGELSYYIANHPKNQLGMNLKTNVYKWWLMANGSIATRQEEIVESVNGVIDDNYAILNLKLGYRMTPKVMPYVELMNATDSQYQEILGARMPGRWWMVGVNWNLN